jgi:SAM-dependent methyltransferase
MVAGLVGLMPVRQLTPTVYAMVRPRPLPEGIARPVGGASEKPTAPADHGSHWMLDPALHAAETQSDHRVEARRAILDFIRPGSVGAELGVFTGLFSEFILRNAAPGVLHLVDPWWKAYGEYYPDWGAYTDCGRLSTRIAYRAATARTEQARGDCAVECHVAFSADWLSRQGDASLDWVYVDSTHHYEDTVRELELLCRKLRPDGYVLGDDWDPTPARPEHAVCRAVHDVLRRHPELELVYAGADHQYALRVRPGAALPPSPYRPAATAAAPERAAGTGTAASAQARGVDWSRRALEEGAAFDYRAFNQACDAAYADLRLVTELRPFSAEAPTVVCVVRNEQLRLSDFLRHYKSIGVKVFHIIDNDSTDDTAKICTADDAVTLWHTNASYAEAAIGQLWVGALARKHGLGKWVLNVDADELFVYPGMEQFPIGALQDWLVTHGCTRMFAPLIDLYGSRPYEHRNLADARQMLSQTPFFDGGTMAGKPCYRRQQTPYGPLLVGGPRNRAMANDGQAFWLSKFPLSLWRETTAYANVHFPYPFAENPGTPYGALLHFKFLGDFAERVREAVADPRHWANFGGYDDYRLYHDWIASIGAGSSLFSRECSRIYRDPQSLVRAGIIEQLPW